MLEWIIIIIALCFIFGVIKMDNLKKQWKIWQPKLKEMLISAKNWSENKAQEAKALDEKKKNDDSDNK